MKTVYVRPAREEDSVQFADWYSKTETFNPIIFQFPETYTLCAFTKGKVLAFMIVQFEGGIQILSRLVVNPKASELEKAYASKELVTRIITIGFINKFSEIYFMGNNELTNRIAKHGFVEATLDEYKNVFEHTDYPIYKLNIKDLE